MADKNQTTVTKLFTDTIIPKSNNVSKIRYNREDLISDNVADELNTYRTFSEFIAFAEIYSPSYDVNSGNEITSENTSIGAPAVRSIFNKSGAVLTGNTNESVINGSSDYRVSHNIPLMDSPSNRVRQHNSTSCSVKDLVKASQDGSLGQATYSYSDFMYCKYLGQVPNTYMVTLRRFPIPVDDFISNIGTVSSTDDQSLSNTYPSIGCMVTWMGTPGNEMSNILKYSVKMPYEEKAVQEETDVEGMGDEGGGALNNIASAMSATYRARYAEGNVGTNLNNYISGKLGGGNSLFNKIIGDPPYNYKDLQRNRDNNKIYGPVDVIKKVYSRGKDGLDFDQNMTLTFEYEMRSFDGINQKQAFLDLISNILNVVYSTGTFWGGGYRIIGQPQNDLFTNLNIFKTDGAGGFSAYQDAFLRDAKNLFGNVHLPNLKDAQERKETGLGLLGSLKNLLNSVAGMFIGGFLNKLGRPHKQFIQSLLSPAPTGFWHVMIGNPKAPIMSLGNMVITNATIEHCGPLGIDDFPTGLKVTVELTRGKPRDIRDIERMYMKGSDRIYVSMGSKVLDMYNYAKEYKGNYPKIYSVTNQNIDTNASQYYNTEKTKDGEIVVKKTINSRLAYMENDSEILKKYFGTSNPNAIIVTAMEQENGSQRLKSPAGTGDQSNGGGVTTKF